MPSLCLSMQAWEPDVKFSEKNDLGLIKTSLYFMGHLGGTVG